MKEQDDDAELEEALRDAGPEEPEDLPELTTQDLEPQEAPPDPPAIQIHERQEEWAKPKKDLVLLPYVQLKFFPLWNTYFFKQAYVAMGYKTTSSGPSATPSQGGDNCVCIELWDGLSFLAVLSGSLGGPWSGGGWTINLIGGTTWELVGVGTADNGRNDCPISANFGSYHVENCTSSVVGSGASSVSGKSAITPYRDEWITWYCNEEGRPMFRDFYEVELNRSGYGALRIPREFTDSVDTDTLRVTSVLPNRPSYCSGTVLSKGPIWAVFLRTQKMGLFGRKATKATVRIEAVRKDVDGTKWQVRSYDQFLENEAFWQGAHSF